MRPISARHHTLIPKLKSSPAGVSPLTGRNQKAIDLTAANPCRFSHTLALGRKKVEPKMTTCVCCNGEAKYFAKFQNRNRIVRRFRCQRCGKIFSEKQPLDDLRIYHDKVVQIVKLLTEGLGVRAIARFVGCDPHTV